jgi:C-8 sterol isomerase
MSYIFDPDVLARIARDALGQPLEVMVEQIAGQIVSGCSTMPAVRWA